MKNNKIQIVRAILALFVVAIHTLPDNHNIRIVVRPFLNISVAAFIFLSGYLTKLEIDTKQFYKKRLLTVLLPYLIFTVAYSAPAMLSSTVVDATKVLCKNLITSSAKMHLYYLVVYAELVLLTPLLVKIAKQKKRLFDIAIMSIQPLFILCVYLGAINHDIFKISPWYVIVFPAWMAYYYFGLLVGNRYKNIKASYKTLLLLFFVGAALQISEGFVWRQLTPMKDLCISQLRITALIQNIPGLLLITKFIRSKKETRNKLLEKIGDASFGIYLLHPAFIMVCDKIIARNEVTFLVSFVFATAGSFITVLVLNKFVPKKLLKYCGLSN